MRKMADVRERRLGTAVLGVIVFLIASVPAFNAVAGGERYDLGIEAYISNFEDLRDDTSVRIEVINHGKHETVHHWYATGGERVLRMGTLRVEGGGHETLALPTALGSEDGWVVLHLGSAGVRLRWPDRQEGG